MPLGIQILVPELHPWPIKLESFWCATGRSFILKNLPGDLDVHPHLRILYVAAMDLCAACGLSLVGASGGHSSCIAWVSHYGDFSCCRQSTGSRRAGSVVMVHRLSCFTVYGMFLDQGLNPCPLHWQADCYPLYHQGNPRTSVYKVFLLWVDPVREVPLITTLGECG